LAARAVRARGTLRRRRSRRHSAHGGFDSRALPGAQSAEDVAAIIADAIETPRADVYTRQDGRAMVASYYAAEDMGEAEAKPPFFAAPPGR
jgi:hypothetical protein